MLFRVLSAYPLFQTCASIGLVHANFKHLYLHTHWKLETCLYEFNVCGSLNLGNIRFILVHLNVQHSMFLKGLLARHVSDVTVWNWPWYSDDVSQHQYKSHGINIPETKKPMAVHYSCAPDDGYIYVYAVLIKFSPTYFGSDLVIFTGVQFEGLYMIHEYTVSLESESPVSHNTRTSSFQTQIGWLNVYHV
jgi:hypothetical protein